MSCPIDSRFAHSYVSGTRKTKLTISNESKPPLFITVVSSAFMIQTRVEVFNILNHPNFAAPLDHRTVFDALGNPVNGAGQIDTTATPSRQMQLGLKVIW